MGTEDICPATLRRGAHQYTGTSTCQSALGLEFRKHGSSVPEGLAPDAERLRRCVDVLSGLTLLDQKHLPGPGGFRMV